MHGFLGKVVIKILLVSKLEDKAVGEPFVERFPRAVLACISPVSQNLLAFSIAVFNTHQLSNS